MGDLLHSLQQAAGGMAAQTARLRHVSENIANADTPGYRRKLVTFDQVRTGPAADRGRVEVGPVRLDPSAPEKIHDPSHPLADAAGYYEGSNVELLVEIADAREAQRSYEANLEMFDQARQMSSRLLELLRR